MTNTELFKPFEDWSEGEETYFGLCIKDGNIFEPKEGDDNCQEWHIERMGYFWLIEYAWAENCSIEVYAGDIPSREFFETLMLNVKDGFDIRKI